MHDHAPTAGKGMPGTALLPLSRAGAEAAFAMAVRRWAEERHRKVDAFADARFTFRGSLDLHRHALGPDLLRAPANIALAAPQLLLQLAGHGLAGAGRLLPRLGLRDAHGAGLARAGTRLRHIRLQLDTDLGRALQHHVVADLLELPSDVELARGRLEARRDSLAEALLAEPAVAVAIADPLSRLAARTGASGFSDALAASLATYADSRAAAAEITTGLAALGLGGAAFHQLTPSTLSLSQALAAALANNAAVASFPLGTTAAPLWYAVFPAAPSVLLSLSATASVFAGAAVLAAFAGLVADPVQHRLGLHQRRLHRLIDALEIELLDEAAGSRGFVVRDHYAARLLDLADLLALLAARVARP